MKLNKSQKKLIELYHNNKLSSDIISDKLKIDKKLIDLYIIRKYFNKSIKANSQIKLTKDIAIKLVKNYYNGISFNKSCKELNISLPLWTLKSKKLNLKFRKCNTFDYSVWTKQQIKLLLNDFNSGIPIYKLVDKYGFNKNVLAKIINDNGGNTTPISFNNKVFSKIETEEQAYWLGFLYADGYVSLNNNDVELSLKLLDAEHLNKFKKFLNSSSRIRLDFKVPRCRFCVSNVEFKEDLIKLGCFPQKSLFLTFPSTDILQEKLYPAFIRGYFDGDGCLSHTYSDTKKKRFTVCTSFIGTKEFCKSLENILNKKEIYFSWYHNKKHADNIWSIKCNKKCSVKLLNYLYENANIYLERKYSKYLFFKKHNNFAVYVSDYIDHDRAISMKAKQWIKDNLNIDIDLMQANIEITKNVKSF